MYDNCMIICIITMYVNSYKKKLFFFEDMNNKANTMTYKEASKVQDEQSFTFPLSSI